MPRKSKKPVRKQTHSPTGKVVGQVGQILLPMIAGIAATKADLTEWVYEQGLTALHLLLREDAEKIAGPKGKHEKERTHNHWGSTDGELSFGGRRIQVSRPRVRSKSGAEASLPHFEAFRAEDPLPERVLNQILVGVSTRNYESSLDKPSAKLKSRGTSKSAASRHLVSQTTKKLEEYLSRRLEEFELAALMMDGLEVAGQTVVVTLGITIDGTKVPLGIWLGSTENSRVCTAMLQNLLERGLRIDESILCVVDGGKGIRKALVDVLGDLAVIQRCQLHKLRNLRSYLPKSRHAYVLQTMKEAYKCKSADKARKRLQALVSWLERNGYDEAAGSLREGMEETLTVVKLALPELLRKSLATTNAIENLNGTIRRVSRNVKRWKSPSMIRRWTALGVVTAEKKFHGVSKAIAIWALSFTRLEANRNLLTAMRLLPKSIHRCRRYPTKFNSGRDIPGASWMPRYVRRTREVDEAILGTYLSGANSRRIRKALKPLLGEEHLSKSAVSRVVSRLKEPSCPKTQTNSRLARRAVSIVIDRGEPQIWGVSEAMSAIRVPRTRRENTVQQRDATLPGGDLDPGPGRTWTRTC